MNLKSFSNRHPDLDWLRIIVVTMLIPFHTAMTFAPYQTAEKVRFVQNTLLNPMMVLKNYPLFNLCSVFRSYYPQFSGIPGQFKPPLPSPTAMGLYLSKVTSPFA